MNGDKLMKMEVKYLKIENFLVKLINDNNINSNRSSDNNGFTEET